MYHEETRRNSYYSNETAEVAADFTLKQQKKNMRDSAKGILERKKLV